MTGKSGVLQSMGHKELDTTESLNNNDKTKSQCRRQQVQGGLVKSDFPRGH